MKDFADTLEQRLMSMAVDVAAEAPEPVTKRRKPRRRFASSIVGGASATAAAVAAFFALSGTSLADLPILKTPTTDASSIKAAVPALAARGVDFDKAHVFQTPAGPGYVMVTPGSDTVCMALPDGTAPGTFGAACGTPLSKVEASGLSAEIVGDRANDPKATSTFAFVLPEGARDPRLTTGGATKPLTPEAGVVVAQISADSTLTWTEDGVAHSHAFSGPFETTGVTCPNGKKSIPVSKLPTTPGRGGGPATIDMRALARLCK